MPRKIERQTKVYGDADAIISSLSYLSKEASMSGHSDLCVAIQTLIDMYPQLKEQDASDPESEIGIITSLLFRYHHASPKVKEQFLSYVVDDPQKEDIDPEH